MLHANQLNVEYVFRISYECIRGACYGGSADASQFSAWLAHIWLWIIIVGYIVAVSALVAIIYILIRLFELRKNEAAHYGTLLLSHDAIGAHNPRWAHIESLASSTNTSDWRTAIIEADILLDDMLTRQGYTGASIGEKLKSVEAADFNTLNDAWEAHKVRNQIAHEGSAFDLSDSLARRTLAHYESVFREFKLI